ncbi:MAG: helical bundle domain-containing protein [Legionella sp.]
MQTQFFLLVDSIAQKERESALQKMNAILRPRLLLEDYIDHLERIKTNHDDLYVSRLIMARSFLGYLHTQTEFTTEVSEAMLSYSTYIRELHPSKGEEVLLNRIFPRSAIENTWRWVTGIGIGFFVWCSKRNLLVK